MPNILLRGKVRTATPSIDVVRFDQADRLRNYCGHLMPAAGQIAAETASGKTESTGGTEAEKLTRD